MTERAYCRVYYSIKDDPKFDTIRADDHHLATWLRLLMAADALWPASPDLPASARRTSVKALVAAELVDILPDGMYRIHGLDAERGTRRDAARASVAHRTYTGRTTSEQRPGYSHSEPSQAETETESEPMREDNDDLWNLYRTLTKATTLKPAAIDWLDRIETTYGLPASVVALREEHAKDPNPGTLLGRANSRLEADARKTERTNGQTQDSERRYSRMVAKRLEWYRDSGKWDPSWGPEPVEAKA